VRELPEPEQPPHRAELGKVHPPGKGRVQTEELLPPARQASRARQLAEWKRLRESLVRRMALSA